jgi:hypothetical protein
MTPTPVIAGGPEGTGGTTAVTPVGLPARAWQTIDVGAVSTWLLTFAVVLYLALAGGGYDLVVRNQVGIAVWWGLLLCGVLGVLANRPRGRLAWLAGGAFGCFLLWTGITATSSVSFERSLTELSRIACYLGVLALGLSIHRDRDRAIRHTVAAVASAVAVVAVLAVISRLRPLTFANATQTASLLPNVRGRLAWPLNYWNGLATLMVLGLPLLLAMACSARRLVTRAVAAGVTPVVVLCGYLTFSRGGAIEAAVALIVFLAFARDRVFKVATAVVIALASGVLIAGSIHRSAIENGLTNSMAQHQGRQLLIVVALVCLGTAFLQVGIALVERHASIPGWLAPSRQRALAVTVGVLVLAVAVFVAAGGVSRISHEWQSFKRPVPHGLRAKGLSRYSVASGNGRYQLWQVAAHAGEQRPGTGWGPGTYAFLWSSRAPFHSPAQNAHSLYLETFAEEGIPGLVLLAAFLAAILAGAVRAAIQARHAAQTQAAAAAAACVAFLVSAAVDWVWQLPVLPFAFLLLGAAALTRVAPRRSVRLEVDGGPPARAESGIPGLSLLRRAGLAVLALGCLFVIAWPLAATTGVRASQAAAGSGATVTALRDAEAAARLEPGGASPQLQVALVLETQSRFGVAISYARRATANEPMNWQNWAVLSRLQAESGHPLLALQAFKRARSLNPHSPLFRQ